MSKLVYTGRPTQKTIARITGFAVPTVSRALADAPDIGEDTKRRVREVAQEIGYRPDRAGVRLRTGKTNVVSLVISSEHDLSNHTSRLVSSVASALRGTPYHVIITPFFAGEDPMIPVRYIVETKSADAVILNQTQPEDPRVAYMMKEGFPFATHGRTNWADQHPYFDFDNFEYARLVVTALADRKRQRILLVLPPMAQNYSRHIRSGADGTAQARGVSTVSLKGASSDDSISAISEAIGMHLQSDPEIDAILCASSGAAVAAAIAVEEQNLQIGIEIDIAGKEAIPLLNQFRSPILAFREDVDRAGSFLAKAVTQRISSPDQPPMQALDVPKGL